MNTPSDQLSPGAILKGKYRVLRVIGGGAMARVYQIEEKQSGGQAIRALKELRLLFKDKGNDTEALRLFEQEAGMLSNLAHPNLPRVIDFFEVGSKVLQWVRLDLRHPPSGPTTCPRCGHSLRPAAKFCSGCGQLL